MKVQVIIGSIRPNRAGEPVAKWFIEAAKQYAGDLELELVDLAEYKLPLYDEPESAKAGQYAHEHTRKWAAKIAEGDAYILVTPEYNHAPAASLKNALDFLYAEWTNKPVAFVSYGSAGGGVRAVEQLRLTVVDLLMLQVNQQIVIPHIYLHVKDGAYTPSAEAIAGVEPIFKEIQRLLPASQLLRHPVS